jgi:hypothetical protein
MAAGTLNRISEAAKKKRTRVVVACVLAALVLAVVVATCTRWQHQPIYQGKTLS